MTQIARWIAHVDMDSFYVSVERIKNPKLKGLPVVVGGKGGRGVVASASYEARKFGVRSAMPMGQAHRLCRSLVVVPPDFTSYSEASNKIFTKLSEICPVIEQVSVDEAYLDFTGCERLYKTREESGLKVKEAVKEVSGLSCTVGIASNKLITKIASDFAKPDGLIVIPYGEERRFMEPLSIRKIPGVGPKTALFLEGRGLQTCKELRDFDPVKLKSFFGEYSLELQRKARGEDDSPVESGGERKSLSAEETFDRDTSDMTELREVARRMSEELGTSLREEGLLCRTIHVKIRYGDFTTHVRSHTLSEPTSLSKVILETAFDLLKKNKEERSLRLFGIACKNFVSENDSAVRQLNFFESPEKQIKDQKLEKVKDELKKRFGDKILMR